MVDAAAPESQATKSAVVAAVSGASGVEFINVDHIKKSFTTLWKMRSTKPLRRHLDERNSDYTAIDL